MSSIVQTSEHLPDPIAVRRTVLQMLYRAGASHVGPCMSMIEILSAAFSCCDVESIRAGARDRDRVFVSKGHSAAAVYAVMHHMGLISSEQLEGYHRDGSLLAGHVSHAVPGVEHSTGALGHGLSVACGAALGMRALRQRGETTRWPLIVVAVGDGELQEGSIWESLMFARHHQLPMIVVVDNNRVSSITRTEEVIDLNPLADRFTGFGLQVESIDGHDLPRLARTFGGYCDNARQASDSPTAFSAIPLVVIANTVKGKGVPFAEGEPVWHYRPLSAEAYQEALAALDAEERSQQPTEV